MDTQNIFIKIKLMIPIKYSSDVYLQPGIHILQRKSFYNKWFTKGLIQKGKIIVLQDSLIVPDNKSSKKLEELPKLIIGKNPLVSICCLTYNHKHCIEDALEGFVMQRTNFPFEIIIYDDCSTDGSQKILKLYEEKYRGVIKLFLGDKNIYSKTKILPFTTHLFPYAKGKYIAECDGDDYWTDPLKLQKQVDFMEKNPRYSLCYNDLLIYYSNTKTFVKAYGKNPPDYTPEELIGFEKFGQWLHPSTKLWRNYFKGHEKDFSACWGDNGTNVLLGTFGSCKYIEGIKPSVFRRFHGNNMWSCMNAQQTYKETIKVYERLLEYMKLKNNKDGIKIRKKILEDFIANPPEKPKRVTHSISVHGKDSLKTKRKTP